MSSLKTKTLRGLFWSIIDSFGAYFVHFVFSVAIARALSPSDYGLMGMIIIFMAIANIVIESGFGMALIQKINTTKEDYSTVFYFNLFVSLIIYIALYFTANIIAEYYNEPILVNIIRVSAITIVVGALGTIQITILSKELKFKKQTSISISSSIISGTTGVIFAYQGYGVWALVFQSMTGVSIRILLLWITSKWRPSFIINLKSLKELYRYGLKIFLQGLSDVIFTKIYYPLIGIYYNTTQLGYYTNANRLSEIIVKQTAIAYGRVLFPSMCSIQKDKEKIEIVYSTVFRLLSFVMFPVSLISILSVNALIELLLTAKWLPAVPYIQLYLIEGYFYALYMLNQNTFNSIGKSGVSLKVDIIKKVLLFINLIIAFRYGIKALIIGQIACSFIVFMYSFVIIKAIIKIIINKIYYELLKHSVIAVILTMIDLIIIKHLTNNTLKLLVLQTIILLISYIILVYIFRVRGLQDVMCLIKIYMPEKVEKYISSRYK